MAVYDDQDTDTKTKPEQDEFDSLVGGISDEEKQQMEDSAYSGAADDIAEREGLGDKKSKSDNDRNNSDDEPENEGGFFKDEETNIQKTGFITKKRGIVGGIIGVVIAGAFGVTSFLSGPLQLVHYGQLLQRFHFTSNSQSSDSRVGRMIEHYRTTADPSKKNMGYLMEKVSQKYINTLSAGGIELDFNLNEDVKSRRLQNIIIDQETPEGKRAINKLKSEGLEGIETSNGKLKFELGDKADRIKRSVVGSSVEAIEKYGKAGPLISRILQKRAGIDMHPLRNKKWDKKDEWRVWRNERKKETSEDIHEGADPDGDRRVQGETESNSDGDVINDSTDIADEANDFVDEAFDLDVETKSSTGAKTEFLKSKLAARTAGGAAAVAAAVCIINDIGNSIPDWQQANIILPAIRGGMRAISVASQIQTGQDVSMDELRVIHDDFYDEETGSSVFAAASIQSELGQEPTGPDAPETLKLKDGKASWLFDIVDQPGVSFACNLQDNVIGIIPGVGTAVEKINGFVTKVTGLDRLMNAIVGFFSGEAYNTFAKGAEKGNSENFGAFFAGNDAAISAGGGQLSTAQAMELKEDAEQDRLYAFHQQSLFSRVFNLYDSQSLVGSAIIQTPAFSSFSSMTSGLANLPVNFLSYLGRSVSMVLPTAHAASETYDYGVPKFGFSEAELANESTANPYDNAEKVEECFTGSDDCKYEKYVKCSGTKIDFDTGVLTTEKSANIAELLEEEDCNDQSQEALEYRMYLLDTMTIKSMACYEGIDESSCTELGFGASTSSPETASSQPATGLAAQYIPDCGVNDGRAAIACTAINELVGIPYDRAGRALPNTPDPVSFLDCSAFTAMALYRTFGVDLGGTASVSYKTYPQFEVIDVHDIQPGDYVGRGTVAAGNGGNGHIGVVVSYDKTSKKLITVEASSKSHPSGLRGVGGEHGYNVGLSADGNGSYEWAVRYIGEQ